MNLPEDFIRETRQLMGEERFNRFMEAFNEEAPVCIRLNPRKIRNEKFLRPDGSKRPEVERGIRNDDYQSSADSDYRRNHHFSFLISHSSLDYLYNVSNRLSQQFYGLKDLTAYELKGGSGPIMQCRHCIRYSLGYCVKHGGKRPTWREPLSLVLGDGRRFRLEFDCQHCQMNVFVSE